MKKPHPVRGERACLLAGALSLVAVTQADDPKGGTLALITLGAVIAWWFLHAYVAWTGGRKTLGTILSLLVAFLSIATFFHIEEGSGLIFLNPVFGAVMATQSMKAKSWKKPEAQAPPVPAVIAAALEAKPRPTFARVVASSSPLPAVAPHMVPPQRAAEHAPATQGMPTAPAAPERRSPRWLHRMLSMEPDEA